MIHGRLRDELKRLLENFVRFLVIAATLGAIVYFVGFLILMFMPREAYFEYESVEPHMTEVGRPLIFRSTRVARQSGLLYFTNMLSCEGADGRFRTVALDRTQELSLGTGERRAWLWEFPYTPEEPTRCYVTAHLLMRLDFGIQKHQTIRSETFEVAPAP